MTTDRDFDRQLGAWFEEVATQRLPDGLLERSLERVGVTSQRPGWLVRERGRSPGTARRPVATRVRVGQLLAVATAVVVVAAGAGLLLRRAPALIGGPSSPPGIAPVPSAPVAPSASPSPIPTPVATPRPAAVIAYINWVYRTNQMAQTPRVWIVRADGTGAHELFPGGTGNQGGVAWSPDGSHLVYTEAGRLYFTDASGSEPRLVGAGSEAAFSSDGTQLVFESGGNPFSLTGSGIETMDLASGRVSSIAGGFSERPRWSADGQQIVFSRSDKFGNTPAAVFIVDADGQNLRQLSPKTLPARLPDWSPDGSRIVFTSFVITYVREGGTTVQKIAQDVYTVRPDWTDLRRLTTDGNSIGATWTPDGRILFATSGGLWTMNADGSNVRLIVPGGSGLDAPLMGIDAALQPTP